MAYEVKLSNNLHLKMTLQKDRGEDKKDILFEYEDAKKNTYEGKKTLKEVVEDTEDEQFLKNKDNYKYELKIFEENEIKLFISKNNIQKVSVSLKFNTPGKENTTDAPPPNKKIEKPTETSIPDNDSENEMFAKIINLKIKYDEAIKKLKEEKEKLIKDNEQIKKEIDEEKRKNDEIVKVFLENREKYELAVNKNSDISQINSKL